MFNKVFQLFLLFSMVVKTHSTLAQKSMAPQAVSHIKGVLLDSISRAPIAFATLILRSRNNQKIGAISDANGFFRFNDIKPEIYNLQVSFVGYHSKRFSGLTVIKGSSLNLDTILLAADNKLLQRVNVVAHTNLVEDKGDRIVYYAESDISNQGGNAIDVLRKAPIVSVDASGNVQMLGSESINILINGKSFNASRSVSDALKMIPANTVKSIEIITSPSARYDSEGTGGILNIITRKNHTGSSSGVILTGGNLTQNVSSSYSLQTEKLGVNFDGSYERNIKKGNSSFERVNNIEGIAFGRLFQRNEFNNTTRGWNTDLGITYDLDSLNLVSLSIANWGQEDPNLTSLFSDHNFTNQPDHKYRQDIDYRNPYGNLSANLAYTHHFKHTKQQFEIISQYSNTYDDYQYSINRYDDLLNSLSYKELSRNKSNSREWTIQADYIHPFDANERKIVEVGAKLIVRDMNSDYKVDDSASGTVERLEVNPSLSNVFDYTQRVLAGYSTFKVNAKSGWLLLAGARLEHTNMAGSFQTSLSSFKNAYINLLPSITISKKIRGKYTIKANFTQRLVRPQVWNLNPYIIPTDPNNVLRGNPELKPELSHFAQLGFSTSTVNGISVNGNMYWRQSHNAMQNIVTVEPDGKAVSYPQNAGHHRRLGLSINVSSDINKDWCVSTNAEAYNANLKSTLIDFSNKGWFFRSSINTSLKLPKKYMVQLFGSYSSGMIWLQRTNKEIYFYSGSLRKEVLKEKAFVTLNIENPFNHYNAQESMEYATGFETYRINNYGNRSFRVSLNWKFGNESNKQERVAKKVINDDNSSR